MSPLQAISIRWLVHEQRHADLFSPLTATDPLLQAGKPLLRRPRNSGNLVARYVGHSVFGKDVHHEWGGTLTGSFIGRRADSDFLFPPLNLKPHNGYARIDLGAWLAVTHRVTAFANIENATDVCTRNRSAIRH